MKYIHCPNLGIVIFEGHIMHAEMAVRLGCRNPKSAGFVKSDGSLECFGESVSLNVKADEVMDTCRVRAFMSYPEMEVKRPRPVLLLAR